MLTLLQGEQGEGLTGPRIWCQATRGRWHVSSLELYLHLGTAWSRFRPQADWGAGWGQRRDVYEGLMELREGEQPE